MSSSCPLLSGNLSSWYHIKDPLSGFLKYHLQKFTKFWKFRSWMPDNFYKTWTFKSYEPKQIITFIVIWCLTKHSRDFPRSDILILIDDGINICVQVDSADCNVHICLVGSRRNCPLAGELWRPAWFWQRAEPYLLGLRVFPHGHHVHCR